jgi:serine/threonine protein kinase
VLGMTESTLGTYRLISPLGAGGMGEVWRAEDTRLQRQVAIKILADHIANDPEWKARFLREARTIAQLNHPNIATIYAIEQEGDKFFIAMELIEGESLTNIMARGAMEPREAVRIMRQVAEALEEAHAKGIVHRDIKPDNVMVSRRNAKVLDFGIAKQIGGTASKDTPALTQGGMIVGTPYYMSPEQALGKPLDHRSDIFSLGVVLYETLAGHRPFMGETMTETMMHIIMTEPPAIGAVAPGVPRGLREIVARCLQKHPDRRFGSAGELIEAFDRIDYKDFEIPSAPATPEKEKIATQPLSVAAPTPSPIPGRRALVADDDPVTRYLIANILSANGFAFDEAANGADAVKCLKQNEYSIIFLDLLMPRIDGWGVLDFMRRMKADKLPRLFVITGVKNQSISVADRDVVAGVIYKPLNPDEVGKAIRQAVAA